MEESFINKVFDAYLKTDYSYGDDNLNPKREIKKDTRVDTNDELNSILRSVQDKIQKIGKKYTKKEKQDNISLNLNNDGKNSDGRIALDLIPSDEDELDKGFTGEIGAGDSINSLLIEIETLIPKILVSINPTISKPSSKNVSKGLEDNIPPSTDIDIYKGLPPTGDSDDAGGGDIGGNLSPEIIGIDLPDLYKIDCSGYVDILSGGNDEDVNKNDGEKADPKKKNSSSINNVSSTNSMDNLEKARDKFLQETANKIDRDNASARECAIADLKILKAISSVLESLRNIKKGVDGFTVTMEACRISVLAAQCWTNPTAVSEIVSRIIQKIKALLIMVTCKLLQLLWNLLGMDCITTRAQNDINNIKRLIAGASSIFSEVDRTALSIGNSIDRVQDSLEEAGKQLGDALNYSVSDRLRDQFDMEEIAKTSANFDEEFKNGLVSEIESSEAYNSLMSVYNNLKTLEKTKNNAVNSFMKYKSKDSEVSKFASRFKNIKAK